MNMLPWRSLLFIAFSYLVIPLLPAQAEEDARRPTTFVFDGFNETDLILEGDASVIRSKSVLALTNSSRFMLGRALYSSPVQMKSDDTVSSFSTTFVFSMAPSPSNTGGSGLAFFMRPDRSPMDPLAAQYFDWLNMSSNMQRYNQFAVEFDTAENVEFNDPDDNHVGVYNNTFMSVWAESAGYWDRGDSFHGLILKSGRNIQAWIDYHHPQSRLTVTITLAGLPRPQRPLISLTIDLADVLQEEMFIGFSADTGNLGEDHYVLGWSFSNEGMAPPLDVSRLPSMYSKGRGPGFIAGVTVISFVVFSLAVAAVFLKRAKSKETIEEWEQEYWSHRFTYKELSVATRRFRDRNILGQGVFGKVYKGILPRSGHEVAVKCIPTDFAEGMKGFVAEISSMGGLQHRNLVQVLGWCRKQKQLFIVSDYMPNGSLDKLIFGNPATVLPWPQRYAILKGVAAGLLFLHEEWERMVIHRDIKSSNVLLDSEFNGRLCDFALAPLYDYCQNPQKAHVVGTLGYIAPEFLHTGNATASSDVFSFGVLLLEVACGRRQMDPLEDPEQMILTDWVRVLYKDGRLVEAFDPNLGKRYDVVEMDRVLKLGLLCCHREPESRPTIRQVCQLLEGEATLPDMRTASLNMGILGR